MPNVKVDAYCGLLIDYVREKGAVDCEKRDVFYYWPLLGRKDYQRWSTQSFCRGLLVRQRPGSGGGTGGVLSPKFRGSE